MNAIIKFVGLTAVAAFLYQGNVHAGLVIEGPNAANVVKNLEIRGGDHYGKNVLFQMFVPNSESAQDFVDRLQKVCNQMGYVEIISSESDSTESLHLETASILSPGLNSSGSYFSCLMKEQSLKGR